MTLIGIVQNSGGLVATCFCLGIERPVLSGSYPEYVVVVRPK